ncbi:hypothetical protein DRH14_02005 [Candidatus Shapirobacteria bacterium]|nr:MAG: hypothetical protein DRH14_02005 [Candidatus Shapirobacteria bacterium]
MSKTASAPMATHIAESVTTLAIGWKITRTDAAVYGFSTHDVNKDISGVTYVAMTGTDTTSPGNKDDLSVATMDISGLFNSDAITEDDLRNGLWNGARVECFFFNWADVSMGIVEIFPGWFGDITIKDDTYEVELRGLTDALKTNMLRTVTPECDAEFGGTRCGVDLDLLEQSGTVATVIDQRTFTTAGLSITSNDEFNQGKVLWTSGNNSGTYSEVRDSTLVGQLTLFLKEKQTIQIGDGFDLWPGCDKRLETCRDTYSNTERFRGFPKVPGPQILSYPDAK